MRVLFCVALLAEPISARAMAPKPPTPPAPAPDSQAYPRRLISFGPLLNTPFMLPDGKTRVDMGVALPDLLITEMNKRQNKIRARDISSVAGVSGQLTDRLILKGGITAFEASNMTGSITIGYRPGVGDIGNGTLTDAQGGITFNVGILDMDFRIVDTVLNETVAVGHGSATPFGVHPSVSLDFNSIHTGIDFVYNSPMSPLFRKAINDAFYDMANNPNTNFYTFWKSSITGVNMDLKRVFFNSGQRDDVKVNDVFTVYDENLVHLGEIKVLGNDMDSSSASYKDDSNGRLLGSTRVGDNVKIYYKNPPQ